MGAAGTPLVNAVGHVAIINSYVQSGVRNPSGVFLYDGTSFQKVILSSETASAFSSRGVYLFPVSKELSAPVRDGRGSGEVAASASRGGGTGSTMASSSWTTCPRRRTGRSTSSG